MPAGSDWIHEIKYDAYRMMLIRDQDRVRLIGGGHDFWTQYFLLIVEAALKLHPKRARQGRRVRLRCVGLAQTRQAGAVLRLPHARERR